MAGWGGSWGVTLALAYAEAHPERVSELVLGAVTNGTPREVERLTRDMGRIFPEEWARCRWEDTHVSPAGGRGTDLQDRDPAFRLCFARLVTHYWGNDCFLPDGRLLREAHRLAGYPGSWCTGGRT